jgi:hypothetical protein
LGSKSIDLCHGLGLEPPKWLLKSPFDDTIRALEPVRVDEPGTVKPRVMETLSHS